MQVDKCLLDYQKSPEFISEDFRNMRQPWLTQDAGQMPSCDGQLSHVKEYHGADPATAACSYRSASRCGSTDQLEIPADVTVAMNTEARPV